MTTLTTPVHFDAIVTPQGMLRLAAVDAVDAAYEIASVNSPALIKGFAKSAGAGLTFLASAACEQRLSASLVFWQQFSRVYFRALCRQGLPVDHSWPHHEPPNDQALSDLLRSAPPMRGLEYLTPESLRGHWRELDEFTRDAASSRKGGLNAYLRALHPDWNVVGRVTFHLAENKRDPQRPFAFLATFTQSSPDDTVAENRGGSLRHVPLSEALRNSISDRNKEQLDVLLEPVSRAAKSSSLISEMLESREIFAPQAWGIRQAFDFLSDVPQIEHAGVIVRVPNWWNASKPPRPEVQVRIGSRRESTLGGGNLDLQVNVAIDGQPLTKEELTELAQAREGMTLLRGKWVQVDQTRLQSALDQWQALQQEFVSGIDFLNGMRMLAGAAIGATADSEELRGWSRIEAGPWLEETLNQLRDPSGKIAIESPAGLNATLRPYQAAGLRWLALTTELGLGACLADDMGLGKTIQVIALLLRMKQQTQRRNTAPSLLILPTSLLGNWKREIEKFAPELRLRVLHPSMMDPSAIRRTSENPSEELRRLDVVATTYGLARREKWLSDFRWRLVVLDEAQAIKNAGAAQTKAIKAIPCDGRIVLTGTPVENHLGDLWSLFDFCSPGLLGTAAQFKKFVKADTPAVLSQRLASLRRLIQPAVLRRMKSDPAIVSDLPAKTEMRVDCGLTQAQATLYRQVTQDLEQALDIASGIQRRGMVLSALMQLKQICNHSDLYLKRSEFRRDGSGKYAELAVICQTLIEKQEKMLVFTQFQSMCRPIEKFLAGVFGRDGLVLTGKTPSKRRGALVEQFQQPTGPPFFVISVKAGGTGLNLTEATHVVHFDRWWNPAVEDQATDRAFRIGQRRNVIVHKFVCRGTLEERIDDMIRSKKQLTEELFGADGEINLTELSNEQILKLVSLDLAKASTT